MLVLNALLGLGTALAPVFVAVFVGLGFWWGLPVLAAVLLVGAARWSALRLPLRAGAAPAADRRRADARRHPDPLLALRRRSPCSTASARR